MSTVLTLPPRGAPQLEQDPHVERLVALCEEVGETRAMNRLRMLGLVHCLAPDISVSEFVRALNAAGLTVSTVGDAQLIHRLPPTAA